MNACSFHRRSTDLEPVSKAENPCANCVNRKHIYAPLRIVVIIPIAILMALSVAVSVGFVAGQDRNAHRMSPAQAE
jgi:hypothetical protein